MAQITPLAPAPPVSKPPSRYLAAFLSLVVPGAGQFYCGYWSRALILWLSVLVAVFVYVFGLLASLPAHPIFDFLGLALQPILRLAVAFDAWRLARDHDGSRSRPNDWVVTLLALGLWYGPGMLASTREVQSFWPLGRTYYIPSGAMQPTLQVGDYLVAMPTSSPKLNDIVVFTPPETYQGDKADLVKRIVGVGGDTIEVADGKLRRNGQVVDEPFIKEPMREDFAEIKVPEGQFFMLGDNRNDSFDSRYWGPVPAHNVRYRVARLLWSDRDRMGRKF